MTDFDGSDDIASEIEGFLAVENAPLALVVLRPDGRVAMANRAWRELLGYDAGEVSGRDIVDFMVERDVAAQRRAELLDKGRTEETTIAFRRRTGDTMALRASSIMVYGDGGKPRMVICRVSAA
jgi:PAS domain S-box-containing protein